MQTLGHKHMAPTPATWPSLSQPAPVASWGAPCVWLMEEEKVQPGLQVAVHNVQTPLGVDSCHVTVPLWDVPEGPWWWDPPGRQNLRQCTWLSTLFGRRNGLAITQ